MQVSGVVGSIPDEEFFPGWDGPERLVVNVLLVLERAYTLLIFFSGAIYVSHPVTVGLRTSVHIFSDHVPLFYLKNITGNVGKFVSYVVSCNIQKHSSRELMRYHLRNSYGLFATTAMNVLITFFRVRARLKPSLECVSMIAWGLSLSRLLL